MLDIDGSNDADTRLQNVRNVLPALFILATFDVGVRQLVYYHDLGWIFRIACSPSPPLFSLIK